MYLVFTNPVACEVAPTLRAVTADQAVNEFSPHLIEVINATGGCLIDTPVQCTLIVHHDNRAQLEQLLVDQVNYINEMLTLPLTEDDKSSLQEELGNYTHIQRQLSDIYPQT